MARYIWTNSEGTEKRIMPIGVIGEPNTINVRSVIGYYDEIQYTMFVGYFPSTPIPYTFAGILFDGSNTPVITEDWSTGLLKCSVQSGNPYINGNVCVMRDFYLGTTHFSVSVGEGLSYANAPITGIMALKGTLQGLSGLFLTIYHSNWEIADTNLSGKTFVFIPQDIWDFAYSVNPYAADDENTEAGDVTGNGGYPNGFPVGNPAATSESKGIVFPFGSGVHCYVVTPAQLNEFSRYMWGSATGVFDEGGLWGKFQNYKFNPIAGILSCHSLPLVLMPAGGGSASISIAGTTLATATGAPCSSQFTTWVSNTIQIPEPWGTFVDYAYATISIYLPFCGIVPVDVSAVVGGSIYVRYYCDVINGNVSAWVVGTDRNGIQQLLKTATGNAAYHIPITGNDNGQGEIIGSIKQAVSSGLSGNVGGLISAGVNIISGAEQHHTESIGSMNGNAGYCASTEVFLICNWAYPIYTGNYDYIRGRPSEVSGTVGSFGGYGEFEVHADSISGATDEEKREIETLLSGGVYV